MTPKADLHIHTRFSDGTRTPAQIIEKAREAGLKAIAITDHDTYQGYLPAFAAGADADIEVIPGIEITSEFNDRECHILGYGFDVGNEPLISFIHAQKMRRYKRARKMTENFKRLGFDITIDEVKAEAGSMNISRNHIADLMVKKGYAPHPNVVFQKWLSNSGVAYYKTDYEDYQNVIKLIHAAGGVAVLAHPGLYYVEDDITKFIKAGIDGFECIHPSHNYDFQKRYREICQDNGLIETGGSDYHGKSSEEEAAFGTVAIDYELVTRLLERCEAIKANFPSP